MWAEDFLSQPERVELGHCLCSAVDTLRKANTKVEAEGTGNSAIDPNLTKPSTESIEWMAELVQSHPRLDKLCADGGGSGGGGGDREGDGGSDSGSGNMGRWRGGGEWWYRHVSTRLDDILDLRRYENGSLGGAGAYKYDDRAQYDSKAGGLHPVGVLGLRLRVR